MLLLPPTQPSPTGEGVKINHFPLGGNRKGGFFLKIKYNINHSD
jgi:hypothetical protein